MYKAMTKANKKLQLARLSQSVMTKGDILAIGKLFNSYRFSSKERQEEIMEIMGLLEEKTWDNGYFITEEQSEFGIDWLKRTILNKKGMLRQCKHTEDFGETDAEIIRDFSRFEFVGFYESSNGWGSHFTPIYRTIDTKGNYFDYSVAHWGIPFIVGRGTGKTKLEKALA